jgi:tetratricopeptide (TPR) repeat protein
MLREARIAHLGNDTATELERLRSAASAFPDEIAPVYALLVFDRQHGLPEPERRRLRKNLERRLGDPEHPLPPSILQRMARDPSADDDLLQRIADHLVSRLEGSTDEADALLSLLAEIQERLGRPEEAAITLRRLWTRAGGMETAWRLLHLELRLEHWQQALDAIQNAGALRETWWPTEVWILSELGRLDEARALAERRVETQGPDPTLDKTSAAVLKSLGWSFRDAERDDEAEALFRAALEETPHDTNLQEIIFHLYASDAKREAQAAEIARNRAQETNPQVLLDQGTQLLAAGDTEGAIELLERAAPRFPRLEPAWFNLGMAAYRLERWTQVAEALGHAAELNPERAASFFFRGVALTHLERCGDAVGVLERALELDPERTLSHYYLAECYRSLGHAEAAERHRKLYAAADSG